MNIRPYLKLARPRQWVKNGFVLPGLIFGHALGEPDKLAATLAATAAFCLMSSAVYSMNDCLDRERDREHPDKRNRPIASGAVSVRAATLFGLLLAAGALALGACASPMVAAILVGYALINLGY